MFIEFYPSSQLRVGTRLFRLEHCERCKRDTTHVFVLQQLAPRVWKFGCLAHHKEVN